mgnify:CR=1 FL=1
MIKRSFPPIADQQALILVLGTLPGEARAAVRGLTDAQLDTPYREGGWSSRQIVHHLADSHMNAFILVFGHPFFALTDDQLLTFRHRLGRLHPLRRYSDEELQELGSAERDVLAASSVGYKSAQELKGKADALVMLPSPMMVPETARLARLASRLPSACFSTSARACIPGLSSARLCAWQKCARYRKRNSLLTG